MTYMNLKAEMSRHGVTQLNAADLLDMTSNNFSMKIREKVPFTVEEMKKLRDAFFPAAHLDYLCESDGDIPSKTESLHAQAEVAYEAALASEEISKEEAEELRGLLHECADMANSK